MQKKRLPRWGSPGSRNTHPRTGRSELQLGCDAGLRDTGVKIFPCHLFPHACYFLVILAPCPQPSGPPSLFFQILLSVSWLTGPTPQEKQGAERGEGGELELPKGRDKNKAESCLTHLTSTWETNFTEKSSRLCYWKGWDCSTLGVSLQYPQHAGSILLHPGTRLCRQREWKYSRGVESSGELQGLSLSRLTRLHSFTSLTCPWQGFFLPFDNG